MKRSPLGFICLIVMIFVYLPGNSCALDEPTFVLEKVLGNVYVGKQGVPLPEGLSPFEGAYVSVNLYVVASEDRSELVIIDAPALPELFPAFMASLNEEFPAATIKAVLLTHEHLDHTGSMPFFTFSGTPIFARTTELSDPPGPYDFPADISAFATNIGPGFRLTIGDGAITAISLAGHTPGQLGFAYSPDGDRKANRLFAGDALLAPESDYGGMVDPYDITYLFRLLVLTSDTFNFELWQNNLFLAKEVLTKNVKLFPGHGAIRDGYYWKDAEGYIEETNAILEAFKP